MEASRSTRSWLNFLLLSLVFGVSYTQFPLYYDTQNQYFFHGLLKSGYGLLRNDWLAGTADPWPVFTLLAGLTYRYLDQRVFYVYYIVLLGIYAYSVLGIVSSLSGIDRSRSRYLAYLALVVALHSPVFGYLSTGTLGFNVGGQLLSGVALQNILGQMLQPSTFGVFLLLSIHLFLRGKPLLAVTSSSLAAVVHPTYILTAAVFTISYMVIMVRRGEGLGKPLGLALYAFGLILPVLVYLYVVFRPTSPGVWAESQAILVNFRFPHHALPARWLGPLVYVKVATTLMALYLIRRTELFWILLLSLVAAVGLTVAQVLSGSNALAVAFPWRLSVFLVPLSTLIILAYVLSRLLDGLERRFSKSRAIVVALSVAVLIVVVGAGVVETVRRFGSSVRANRIAVMRFVRETKSPGLTYLIPSFYDDFRLFTGAPVFADWDFIPYNDVAFIEWHKRFRLADAFYKSAGGVRCRMLGQLSAGYGVTHVVIRENDSGVCGDWQLLFRDQHHRLYKVVP